MRRAKQQSLEFKSWGGARIGAGRKPKGSEPGAPHKKRPKIVARHPLHVTLRIRSGLPSLRTRGTFTAVSAALTAGSNCFGLRIVQYVVMTNHLHLLCEAPDGHALTQGVKGLCVRLALALNRRWKRSGPVFAERYHVHVLKTPREVKNALVYVFRNAAHHGIHFAGPDPFSSAKWFDEEGELAARKRRTYGSPLPRARTWLLSQGWRRQGAIPTGSGDRRT
jgi:REP element-mobilizing transposase RayT